MLSERDYAPPELSVGKGFVLGKYCDVRGKRARKQEKNDREARIAMYSEMVENGQRLFEEPNDVG